MDEERDAIVATIRAIVGERLKISPSAVPFDRNLMIDLGLESLDLIGVLLELEERFGPLPADASGTQFQTLDDLATYFARGKS
jgi:acyl carrier protein